jgi:hypothetical protein
MTEHSSTNWLYENSFAWSILEAAENAEESNSKETAIGGENVISCIGRSRKLTVVDTNSYRNHKGCWGIVLEISSNPVWTITTFTGGSCKITQFVYRQWNQRAISQIV